MWWIVAIGRPGTKLEGRPVIKGCEALEIRAQDKANDMGGNTELFNINTINEAAATRKIKALLVERYAKEGQWEKGMTRFSHPTKHKSSAPVRDPDKDEIHSYAQRGRALAPYTLPKSKHPALQIEEL